MSAFFKNNALYEIRCNQRWNTHVVPLHQEILNKLDKRDVEIIDTVLNFIDQAQKIINQANSAKQYVNDWSYVDKYCLETKNTITQDLNHYYQLVEKIDTVTANVLYVLVKEQGFELPAHKSATNQFNLIQEPSSTQGNYAFYPPSTRNEQLTFSEAEKELFPELQYIDIPPKGFAF